MYLRKSDVVKMLNIETKKREELTVRLEKMETQLRSVYFSFLAVHREWQNAEDRGLQFWRLLEKGKSTDELTSEMLERLDT